VAGARSGEVVLLAGPPSIVVGLVRPREVVLQAGPPRIVVGLLVRPREVVLLGSWAALSPSVGEVLLGEVVLPGV
jgi:hypothetical protein